MFMKRIIGKAKPMYENTVVVVGDTTGASKESKRSTNAIAFVLHTKIIR